MSITSSIKVSDYMADKIIDAWLRKQRQMSKKDLVSMALEELTGGFRNVYAIDNDENDDDDMYLVDL